MVQYVLENFYNIILKLWYNWCPFCGAWLTYKVDYMLVGGLCSQSCPKCRAGIACSDPFTLRPKKETYPVNLLSGIRIKIGEKKNG